MWLEEDQVLAWAKECLSLGPNKEDFSRLVKQYSELTCQIEILRNELRVENMHGEGQICDICTHMEIEQMDKLLGEALDREDKIEETIEQAIRLAWADGVSSDEAVAAVILALREGNDGGSQV